MKKPTKKELLLSEQIDRLQNQLDKSIELNKDMEEAYNKLVTKYDLVRNSHHMTTQIFQHN
mgnify:FL=1|jgi:hypothetical protein|tara:strand:- start:480 stop:662 length:183 start_codon:yes stop_codon:yes gene_type:complete